MLNQNCKNNNKKSAEAIKHFLNAFMLQLVNQHLNSDMNLQPQIKNNNNNKNPLLYMSLNPNSLLLAGLPLLFRIWIAAMSFSS